MIGLVWLSLAVTLVLIVLLPVLFGELLAVSLGKLHLSGTSALLLVVGVVLGGFVNVPIRRLGQSATLLDDPLAIFGLGDFWPELRRVRRETVLAVNLGGCVIPACLALYETALLANAGLLGAVLVAAAVNVVLCQVLARPVQGIGIALPALVPALAAAALAMLLAPGDAPPVAFVAGVAGPLIGADLLHLRDVGKIASGVVSIGGAGTFDGIVLSGIVAAYLA